MVICYKHCFLLANCSKPLGMGNHQIPDSAISASSERMYYLRASQGRLHMHSFFPWLPVGWSAAVSSTKQWLQIRLQMKTKVTGIATQGLGSRWSPDQWVTSYQVSYKDNKIRWVFYKQWGKRKVSRLAFLVCRHTQTSTDGENYTHHG